ncbi:hypothetical protein [Actinomadura harenae]|uniref:Uncharacterized protein n=1 Tax=Actinomadura harenae TaxID=2483351 RepID=A0A3M2MDP5_9ACTN|nr:hypothetical protein [Actinomadura harenae]RMI47586.1 hypothetical protein EBO15_01410 [Actinomadura harenae]
MTWFKVDDTLAFHRKVVAAGNAAMGLWVRAGSWSAQQLTDGFVPKHMVASLGTRGQAEKLVAVGLWEHAEGGYVFHGWNERQPTRQQVEQEREAARERMRRRRTGSDDVRANTDRTNEGTPPVENLGKTPDAVRTATEIEKDLAVSKTQSEPGQPSALTENPQATGERSAEHAPEQSPNFARSSATPSRPVPSRRDVGTTSPSSTGSRDARESDDDQKPTDDDRAFLATIVDTLHAETGELVTDAWAARVRDQILTGRDVRRPLPYLIKTIQERPRDFLPTSSDGSASTRPDPQLDRVRAPDQDDITARGITAARDALHRKPPTTEPAEEARP